MGLYVWNSSFKKLKQSFANCLFIGGYKQMEMTPFPFPTQWLISGILTFKKMHYRLLCCTGWVVSYPLCLLWASYTNDSHKLIGRILKLHKGTVWNPCMKRSFNASLVGLLDMFPHTQRVLQEEFPPIPMDAQRSSSVARTRLTPGPPSRTMLS